MTTATKTARTDIYTRVTDRIAEQLSHGVRPWLKPWKVWTRCLILELEPISVFAYFAQAFRCEDAVWESATPVGILDSR